MENQFQFNKVLKYGIIIALINIIYFVVLYVIDIKMMISFWNIALSLIISIGILIYAILSYRKDVGGYLSFKNAFLSLFLMFIISGLIGMVFQLFLYNVIDPSIPDTLDKATIQMTESMMLKVGAPEEQIDKAIAEMQAKDQFATFNLIKSSILNIVIGGLIFSLILGAIFKKNKPELE